MLKTICRASCGGMYVIRTPPQLGELVLAQPEALRCRAIRNLGCKVLRYSVANASGVEQAKIVRVCAMPVCLHKSAFGHCELPAL